MRHMLSGALLAFILVLGGGGCGDADAEAPSAVPASELCAQLTDALCTGSMNCCAIDAHRYASHAVCIDENIRLCEGLFGAEAMSPAYRYDEAAAGRLAHEIEAAAAGCTPLPDFGLAHGGLPDVIVPALPDGAPCGVDGAPARACVNECVPTIAPAGDGGVGDGGVMDGGGGPGLGGAGVCGVADHGDGTRCLGGPLSGLMTSTCDDGLACTACELTDTCSPDGPGGALGEQTCAPAAGLDQECSLSSCAEGLFCEGASIIGVDPSGRCTPARADSEPCETRFECAGGECFAPDAEDRLEPAAYRCMPEPPNQSHCRVWERRIG